MICAFSRYWPWDLPTYFISKIRQDEKGHTVRNGDRWNPGDKIHFWSGSPRQKHKGSRPFSLPFKSASYWYCKTHWIPEGIYDPSEMSALFDSPTVLHEVAVPVVYAVEKIFIVNHGHGTMVFVGETAEPHTLLLGKELDRFVRMDGFASLKEVDMYFGKGEKTFSFVGQIVHWKRGNLYNAKCARVLKMDTDVAV